MLPCYAEGTQFLCYLGSSRNSIREAINAPHSLALSHCSPPACPPQRRRRRVTNHSTLPPNPFVSPFSIFTSPFSPSGFISSTLILFYPYTLAQPCRTFPYSPYTLPPISFPFCRFRNSYRKNPGGHPSQSSPGAPPSLFEACCLRPGWGYGGGPWVCFFFSSGLCFFTSPRIHSPSPGASQTGCLLQSYSARRSSHPLSRWSRPWTAVSLPSPAPPARSSARYT